MAASVAQFASGWVSGGSSVTTNAINTAASGRKILVICSDAGAITSITDNKSNIYDPLGSGNSNAGNLLRAWLCDDPVGGSNHTFTATLSSSGYPVIVALEISGALTIGPNDSGAYNQGGDDFTPYTITTSGASLAQASNLVISAFTFSAGTTDDAAVGSPFSIVYQFNDTSEIWPLNVAKASVNSTSPVTASWTKPTSANQTSELIIVIKSSAAGNIVEADAAITAGSDDAFAGAKLLAGTAALPLEEAGAWGGAKLLSGDMAGDAASSDAFVATALAAAIAAVTADSTADFVSGTIKSAVWAATADLAASFESNAIASGEGDFTASASIDSPFDGGAVASGAASMDAGEAFDARSSAIVSSAFDMEGAWDAQGLGSIVLSGVASAVLELVFEASGEAVEIPGGGGALTPAALLRIMRRPASNRTMNRPAGSRVMRRPG